jgi:hypothetical protein
MKGKPTATASCVACAALAGVEVIKLGDNSM